MKYLELIKSTNAFDHLSYRHKKLTLSPSLYDFFDRVIECIKKGMEYSEWLKTMPSSDILKPIVNELFDNWDAENNEFHAIVLYEIDKPTMVDRKINISELQDICQNYLDAFDAEGLPPSEETMKDFKNYIFQQAMQTLFGNNVFDYINSRIK